MTAVRLFAALLAVLLLAPAAAARSDAPKLSAPENLRAFLLRVDEPQQDPAKRSFPRTPSFAWKPVPRTLRYEFQLSTSSRFRDNGIVYVDRQLKAPAVAVPIALPWITGKPYALYARVRAVTQTGTTPWTDELGFNMRSSKPEPLSPLPGLFRWTPVLGATSYQVWLKDAGKGRVISTATNVADQREFYTFHPELKWIGSLEWRVRAVRVRYGTRANSLPAVSYGPWSAVYTAVNPAFQTGPLNLLATVSGLDTVTDESEDGDAHSLMPAFTWTGNTVLGESPPLYRVYVSTDEECVNTVFVGSAVGSPAFAPRTLGVHALPKSTAGLEAAEGQYLRELDDEEPVLELSADGEVLTPNENAKPADTAADPSDEEETEEGDEGDEEEKKESGESAGAKTSAAPAPTEVPPVPPVDLWDTTWPEGGYYWTVVGVEAVQDDAFETKLATAAALGATTLTLEETSDLQAGNVLEVGISPQELVTISEISGRVVTLDAPTAMAHAAGDEVIRSADSIVYRDMELPQDVCEQGRVLRFGRQSEPAVAIAGTPLVSGLSTTGRLISATSQQPAFYGSPVVAWNPAGSAHAYEVQWGTSADPFKASAKPITTYSTSAVLTLKPGTWYYRVRGLNLNMPAGAKALGWSDPVKIVVARPRFSIVKK